MTDDIVTRLRNVAPYAKAQDHASIDPYYFSLTGLVSGAADEIERLRADRDRWMRWGTHVFVCPNKGLNPCEECVAPNTRDAMNRYDRGGAW